MTLERIIRPFQTGDVTPPRRYVPSDAGTRASPPKNVLLQAGKVGSTKTFTGSVNFTQTYYLDTRQKEKKFTGGPETAEREMQIQRIRNPDDPSQFVDIASTNKYTVQEGTGATFKRSLVTLQTGELAAAMIQVDASGVPISGPADVSEVFKVKKPEDLTAAAARFREQHPE
jgi:hypothetical protein